MSRRSFGTKTLDHNWNLIYGSLISLAMLLAIPVYKIFDPHIADYINLILMIIGLIVFGSCLGILVFSRGQFVAPNLIYILGYCGLGLFLTFLINLINEPLPFLFGLEIFFVNLAIFIVGVILTVFSILMLTTGMIPIIKLKFQIVIGIAGLILWMLWLPSIFQFVLI